MAVIDAGDVAARRRRLGEIFRLELCAAPAAKHALENLVDAAPAGTASARTMHAAVGPPCERLEMAVAAETDGAGQGLKNMKARSASIGAWLRIRSRPGLGTAVEVTLRA